MEQLSYLNNRRTLAAVVALLGVALATPLHAITNGQLDGTAHPYVGVFITADGTNACSGSLISPWLFLTAGHCVYDGESVVATTADDAYSPDAVFVSGTGHRDPECTACGNVRPHSMARDIAVITLDQPIFVSRYAQLPEEGLADTLRQGQLLTVVGYGAQGVDPSTKEFLNTIDGKRRRATVKLGSAGASFAGFLKLSANPGGGKGGICYVDSGGPALLGDTVLSVNSDVVSPLCTGVTYGYRIDQASALAFIQSFLP